MSKARHSSSPTILKCQRNSKYCGRDAGRRLSAAARRKNQRRSQRRLRWPAQTQTLSPTTRLARCVSLEIICFNRSLTSGRNYAPSSVSLEERERERASVVCQVPNCTLSRDGRRESVLLLCLAKLGACVFVVFFGLFWCLEKSFPLCAGSGQSWSTDTSSGGAAGCVRRSLLGDLGGESCGACF